MTLRRSLYLLSLLLMTGSAGAARPPADILKEAHLQETSMRDPDAAAALYGEFLRQTGTTRAQQADAYLGLGRCQDRLGKTDEARAAWKTLVDRYPDQGDAYATAQQQLQRGQTVERVVVRESSPVLKVVYEPPPARWLVEFPRATFIHTLDNKGRLTTTAAGGSIGVTRFVETDAGVALEAGSLGSYGPPGVTRDIGYFGTPLRVEEPLMEALRLFGTLGPNLYFFTFKNKQKKETRFAIGASAEVGLVVGLPRGFAFEFGYLLHAFGQTTPSKSFRDTIPAGDVAGADEVLQNRGLRLAAGPTVALSFRW